MKDKYILAKDASRNQMLRELEADKKATVREIMAIGKQCVAELESIKPPSRWKRLRNKIKKVLGV